MRPLTSFVWLRGGLVARAALCLGLAVMPLLGGVARAQSDEEPASEGPTQEELDEAVRLSNLGRLHYDGGEFAEAAEAFGRAFDLAPEPVLGYNAGRSYENAGEYDAALEMYQATLDMGADDAEINQRCSEGVTRIRNLLARLEREQEEERLRQQAVLSVVTEPSGASILVDGELLAESPAEILLAAGSYEVSLESPGRTTYSELVELEPGQSLAMRVALPEAPPQSPPEEIDDGDGGPAWWAVGLTGGVGVALVTLGALSAAGAHDRYNEASTAEAQRDQERFDDLVQEGEDLKRASTLLYGLGIGAIATAVLLYFVTDTSSDESAPAQAGDIDVDVSVGGDGLGASLGIVF